MLLLNRDALLDRLRELSPQVTDHESLATYNPDSTLYRLNRAKAVKAAHAVDTLVATLAEEPAFAVFDETPLRTSPTSAWSGSHFHLARWLLAQARLMDPEHAVRQLEQFLVKNASDALEVMPLWGLNPMREIPLVPPIRLVPLADIPATVPKDMLTGVRSARYADKNTFAWAPRPKAALVRAFVHSPILNPAGVRDPTWPQKLSAPVIHDKHMLEIALILTLLRPSPVFPVAHWFQIEEDIPVIANVGGWSGYEYHRRFVEEVDPEDHNAEALHELVSKYFALPEQVRLRLAVPLERLRLALLRVTPVDTALDLGIALEALLTQDQDSEAPISYRLRLRATHLIGGDHASRKATANRLRIVYRLRSRAAHGGQVDDAALKKEGGAGSVRDYLQECARLTSIMIRKIVRLGSFPDWEGLAMGWAEPVP